MLALSGESLPEYRYFQPPQVEFWVYVVMMLLLVPVQCYAEELAYRGFMMQMLGRWLRTPWLPIVLPAVLFMLSHAYDPWGQSTILAMGIYAGFLCWYTGGLEASISLHVANNVILMLLSMVAGLDPFASEGVTPLDALQGIALEGVYVVLACLIFNARARRGEVSRETQPLKVDNSAIWWVALAQLPQPAHPAPFEPHQGYYSTPRGLPAPVTPSTPKKR